MLDKQKVRDFVVGFIERMYAWELGFYKDRRGFLDADKSDDEVKEKAGLSLSNILNGYVVNDKVNYSRLDAMNCQFPSRYECEEVKLSDVPMADNSAYVLYTQKRGFQEAMRIEVDLNLKKIRKIEFLDIRNKWKRVEA